MEINDIKLKMLKLSEVVIERVKEYKSNKKIIKAERSYVKLKTDKTISERFFIGDKLSIKHITKEEWNFKSNSNLMREIKELKEYKELPAEISKQYGIPAGSFWPEYYLSLFLEKLINTALNDIQKETLDNLITTFIRDLNREPIERN